MNNTSSVGFIVRVISSAAVLAAAAQICAAPLRIMPLGDSITYGTSNATGAYRTKLWQDFGSDANNLTFYGSLEAGPPQLGNKHTEGHSGFTIAVEPGSGYGNITDSIAGYLNARLFPDVILLMIGTNDINRDYQVDQAPAKLDHLISLISDLSTGLRPNAKLIVSSILPIDDAHNQFRWPGTDSNRNAAVDVFNATIPGIVAAHRALGEHVYFTDIHSLFTFSDIEDGLHPTPAGFNKLGDAWYAAINSIVPEPSSFLLLVGGAVVAGGIFLPRFSGKNKLSFCRRSPLPLTGRTYDDTSKIRVLAWVWALQSRR
jgi:lysophospholipase L1-like esterase